MQSRKSDADVESICEICPSLTGAQVLKLVKSYTPDDCEDAISHTFIERLARKLSEIKENAVRKKSFCFILFFKFYLTPQPLQETFTMDENYIQPLKVVFKYNDIKLEDIEIAEELKINSLVTKI